MYSSLQQKSKVNSVIYICESTEKKNKKHLSTLEPPPVYCDDCPCWFRSIFGNSPSVSLTVSVSSKFMSTSGFVSYSSRRIVASSTLFGWKHAKQNIETFIENVLNDADCRFQTSQT